MAGGFKKKLPMSAALRQGGEGTVAPPKPGAAATLGAAPTRTPGATAIPKLPNVGKTPKMPTIGKQPKFK